MKKRLFVMMIFILLLGGCEKEQQEQQIDNTAQEVNASLSTERVEEETLKQDTEGIVTSTNDGITQDSEGKLHFDLSGTTQIQLQSVAGHEGVMISNPDQVKEIIENLKEFTPYSPEEGYEPEYEYTITFYQGENQELAQIKAYDNFIISYEGKFFYDESESFYLWSIREPYIKAAKASFSVEGTVFSINGETFDLKELDFMINALEEYFWFGNEDLPDSQILFIGHINPYVGYGAVFDVEKMDYTFKNYGTNFTYKDYSALSLVYVFEETVYNYWGSSLYHNEDTSKFIYDLDYSGDNENLVIIRLSSKENEKISELTRLNYYHIEVPEDKRESRANLLSELKADLTHDGKEELIKISGAKRDTELTYLDILATDSSSRLWTETAHPAHAGWNSVYLYRKDGMDYLLVFNPYQSTGLAEFTFALFYITGENKIDIIDSGAYEFSYGAKEGDKNYFDEVKFRDFAHRVNTYLKDSILLLSTEGGTLLYSTPENRLLPSNQYETEKWLKEIKESLY